VRQAKLMQAVETARPKFNQRSARNSTRKMATECAKLEERRLSTVTKVKG